MPIKIGNYDYWRVEDSFGSGSYITHGYTNTDYMIEKHSQQFYELNVITRGEGTHYFGSRTYPASCGDVFIIPPGILHGYDGGVGFDVYHIILSPTFMQRNFANLLRLPAFSTIFHVDPLLRERVSDDLHLKLNTEDFRKVNEYLKQMEAVDKTDKVSDGVLSEAYAVIIITMLCSAYQQRSRKNENDNPDSDFLRSISYIFDNYNENISLDTLVRMARMSRTAYIQRFKQVTGMTPGSFIANRRVEMAKQLLADTSLGISEIAATIGCYDASHLTKLFKRYVGVTPSEYRKVSCN